MDALFIAQTEKLNEKWIKWKGNESFANGHEATQGSTTKKIILNVFAKDRELLQFFILSA